MNGCSQTRHAAGHTSRRAVWSHIMLSHCYLSLTSLETQETDHVISRPSTLEPSLTTRCTGPFLCLYHGRMKRMNPHIWLMISTSTVASVNSFTCRSMSVSILFWAAWEAISERSPTTLGCWCQLQRSCALGISMNQSESLSHEAHGKHCKTQRNFFGGLGNHQKHPAGEGPKARTSVAIFTALRVARSLASA